MVERKGTTMSVREMGRMLGLKKVESYWLVHKGLFKTIQLRGKIRVDTASFEYWYAGQVKYHKVNGDPPGERLRRDSYSAEDIGQLLGVSTSYAHVIMKRAGVRYILVHDWKRFPKEEFERWYQGQSRYRTTEDRAKDEKREMDSLSFPDVARLLDITRDAAYALVRNDPRRNIFEIITVADRKRITKKSFEEWYIGQTRYLKPADRSNYPEYKPGPTYKDQLYRDLLDRQRKKQKKLSIAAEGPDKKTETRHSNRISTAYLTVDQAAFMAGKSKKTIMRWIKEKRIPAVVLTPLENSRIERAGFDRYINNEEGEQ